MTYFSSFLSLSPGPSKAILQDMLSNLGGEEPVPPPSSTSSSSPPSRPRPVPGIDLTDEPGMYHMFIERSGTPQFGCNQSCKMVIIFLYPFLIILCNNCHSQSHNHAIKG